MRGYRRDRTSLHGSTRRGCVRAPPSFRAFSRRRSGAPCMSPGTYCRGRRPRGWPRWRGRRRQPRSCSFRRPEAAARCCSPCRRRHGNQTPPTPNTGLSTRCSTRVGRRRQAIRRGERARAAERRPPCGAACQPSGRPTLVMCTLASGRLAAHSFDVRLGFHGRPWSHGRATALAGRDSGRTRGESRARAHNCTVGVGLRSAQIEHTAVELSEVKLQS